MGPRKQTNQQAILSVLNRIDELISSTKETYETEILILDSIDSVIKNEVSSELKKQTSVLSSIEAVLRNNTQEEFKGGDVRKTFGAVAGGIERIINAAEKFDPKKGKKVRDFFVDISTGLAEFLDKIDEDKVDLAGKLMKRLALGIFLYSVSIALATPFLVVGLVGSAAFAANMFFIGMGLSMIDGRKTRRAINSLYLLSGALVTLGIGMLAFTILTPPIVSAHTILSVGAIALTFFVIGKGATSIFRGALALAGVSIALAALAVGVHFFNKTGVTLEDSLLMSASIAAIALPFMLAGIGPIPGFIFLGSLALGFASLSLFGISAGLNIFKKADFGLDDIAVLGGTLLAIGTSFALAGIPPVSMAIGLGAIALGIAGLGLISISAGLAAMKGVDFDEEDAARMNIALSSMVSGFLGGDTPGGIIEGVKYAAKLAARTALLAATVPIMVLAGSALMPIALGLGAFKKVKFNQTDSENLELAIASTIRAFSLVTDTELQKKYGINVTPKDLFFGINSFIGIGNVLGGLARGIKDFANLEIVEYEVINSGTEKAKLVPKSSRKLSKGDFQAASENIALVVSTLAEPLSAIGRLEKEGLSGNTVIDAIFGSGYVSAGIDSIVGLGNIVSGLGRGIKEFANLEIVEYEVVNAGTSKAKLVPKTVRKLSSADFEAASMNIGKIVGFLAQELAKIGKMEADSDGWFKDGYVQKGRDAIVGIGGDVYSLAESIIKLSNAEITEYRVVDGKLVPYKTRKITSADIEKANSALQKILSVTIGSMISVGRMITDNEDEIEIAKENIISISDILSESAKPVVEWSKLSDPLNSIDSIRSFINGTLDIFNIESDSLLDKKINYFSIFVYGIKVLSEQNNELAKTAAHVDKIQKSMKLMKEHINSMDLEKLSITDSVMKSIASISNSTKNTPAIIEKAIKEAFTQFAKIVSDSMANAVKKVGGVSGGTQTQIIREVSTGNTQQPVRQIPQEPSITPEEFSDIFREVLESTILQVKVEEPLVN